MGTPFLLDAAGASYMVNLFAPRFFADESFSELLVSYGEPTLIPSDYQFFLDHGLGSWDTKYTGVFRLNASAIKALCLRAQLPVTKIVLQTVDRGYEPRWTNLDPPITDYPYILPPQARGVIDGSLKGQPLTVYDVLLALRLLNIHPNVPVAQDVAFFPESPDQWDANVVLMLPHPPRKFNLHG